MIYIGFENFASIFVFIKKYDSMYIHCIIIIIHKLLFSLPSLSSIITIVSDIGINEIYKNYWNHLYLIIIDPILLVIIYV